MKEGNSFPFSFVQLPRGSPFISLPLSCFSLPQIRDFLGFFFTSLFCPSHLVFIRNPKKHSTTFFLPLVWLCYCVCSVSFYFPNCPFCSFLALFPFCCHLLLTCDPTTDTDLQNIVRLHPEADRSFPFCFSFFCCTPAVDTKSETGCPQWGKPPQVL